MSGLLDIRGNGAGKWGQRARAVQSPTGCGQKIPSYPTSCEEPGKMLSFGVLKSEVLFWIITLSVRYRNGEERIYIDIQMFGLGRGAGRWRGHSERQEVQQRRQLEGRGRALTRKWTVCSLLRWRWMWNSFACVDVMWSAESVLRINIFKKEMLELF